VYNGVVYGLIGNGGTNSAGRIFSLNIDGTNFQTLFNIQINYFNPDSLLILNNTIYVTSKNGGITGVGNLYSFAAGNVTCFREDTDILCLIDGEEKYVPIQHLRKGIYVKTMLDGYKPISHIGHSKIYNPGHELRCKNRLYKYAKGVFPEITDDLYITGCHSVLVNYITKEQKQQMIELVGDIYVTDGRYRLLACLDENASPYRKEGLFNIWHLALESDNYYMNYGIYANGLLVETTSHRMILNYSGMELIE
jgi:hypothetical protein